MTILLTLAYLAAAVGLTCLAVLAWGLFTERLNDADCN
jgi:hypothetical protein